MRDGSKDIEQSEHNLLKKKKKRKGKFKRKNERTKEQKGLSYPNKKQRQETRISFCFFSVFSRELKPF